MFDFTKPQPLAEAVAQLSQKTPIGSVLRTADWQRMPAALRDQAFFSAGVESVRVLDRSQAALLDILNHARDTVTGVYQFDRSRFIAEMQKLSLKEGLKPADPELHGGLQDPTSEARLALIYQTQIGLAQGKSYWLQGQDPDVLNAWPAQELIRIAARKKPRDWQRRWQEAASKVSFAGVNRGSQMIALKTSPIWIALSRFGTPYPPFDFNSGMGLREIDREEAESLELVKPKEILQPNAQEHLENLAASVKGLNVRMLEALQKFFGEDQVAIEDGAARWRGFDEQGRLAVEDYTRDGYIEINHRLRTGDIDPEFERRVDRLNEWLGKLPDFQGAAYRGTPNDYDLSKYRDHVGQVITEASFISSTSDPAKTYEGPVQFLIVSQHGKSLEQFTATPGQDEVLFRSGTGFRVLDYREDAGEIRITLEEQ